MLPVIRQLAAQSRSPFDRHNETRSRGSGTGGRCEHRQRRRGQSQDPRCGSSWRIERRIYLHAYAGHSETMQLNPCYNNVVDEVNDFFGERLGRLEKHGIEPERIIFDPGIGFGKRIEHNLKLLRELGSLTKWDRP